VTFTRENIDKVLASLPKSRTEQLMAWSIGAAKEPTHITSTVLDGDAETHWYGVIMPFDAREDDKAPQDVVSEIKKAHAATIDAIHRDYAKRMDELALLLREERSACQDYSEQVLALQAQLERVPKKDAAPATDEVLKKELSETQDDLEEALGTIKVLDEMQEQAIAEATAPLRDIIAALRGVLTIEDTPAMMQLRAKEAAIALEASDQIHSY